MAGGLMQLTFIGGQNLYLTGNPQISFFKAVYKTHTNFSMESKRLDFNRTTLNIKDVTNIRCKILRHGDLVSNIYLCLNLPNIYSNDNYCFKWVENIGLALINNMEIYIGGLLIDKQYGEWIHIWNELTIPYNKQNLYNKMIGNIVELYDPEIFNEGTYPSSTQGSENPSIKGRQLIIPLTFWFNNNIGLALPLISIQYQEVEIRLELKALIDLYRIKENGFFIKPDISDPNHQLLNYVNSNEINLNETDIEANIYLEANYIYLDNLEREQFAKKEVDYLIEQVIKIEKNYIDTKNEIIELNLHNPVKELVWVLKRSDTNLTNDWFNFTDVDLKENIIKKCKIIMNGLDRIEDKNSEYFTLIQPYQHHGQTKDGIYVYSFSIKPNTYQPSGSCNMSKINKIQLYLNLNTPIQNTYNYNLNIYSISYNFLRVISGQANVAFHL